MVDYKVLYISYIWHCYIFVATLSKHDAFVATTRSFTILVEEGGKVPFNDILFQTGSGFDISTHTFTCQHDGIYLFSTSIVSRKN